MEIIFFILGAVAGGAYSLLRRYNSGKEHAKAFLLGVKDAHEQIAGYQQFLYLELANEPHTEAILGTVDACEAGMMQHYLDRKKELQG